MIKAIATIAVIMLLVGTVIYAQGPPPVPSCVSDEDRVNIRAQVLGAVDEAFRENVKHLFIGWIKDARDQPKRAAAGLQSSIVAYQRARADALKWTPVAC